MDIAELLVVLTGPSIDGTIIRLNSVVEAFAPSTEGLGATLGAD
jgi:hypothetical protein